MKILWLVNIIMPELAHHLGTGTAVSGGWLTGALDAVRSSGNELVVCTTVPNDKFVGEYDVNGVKYCILKNADIGSMQADFRKILGAENPDVVHLYGTEFERTWALASVSDPDKTLVSVQGFVHRCAQHISDGIPDYMTEDNIFHKILRFLHKEQNNLALQKQSYIQRSEYEINTLKRVRYVNGGTFWGDGCTKLINPEAVLLQCGLILRDSFYGGKMWEPEKCERHTVFTANTYQLKGFHMFLEALNIVKQRYPDVKVYVAGSTGRMRNFSGIRKYLMDKAPDYDWYVQSLIEKYGLRDNLEFCGYLGEQEMQDYLLKSNVFVSASSIENHSTALGEAMISGVPSIASCVGGLQEMIEHGEDGFLYPFEETYMLAYYICRIFENDDLARKFSVKGREHASRTYNREENCKKLLGMYETIYNNGK